MRLRWLAVYRLKNETVSGQMYDWHIDGLMGGHSGMEIDKERANANKALVVS